MHKKQEMKNPIKTLIRLFAYFRYQKVLFICGILLISLSTVVQVLANGMISPVVDAVAVHKDYQAFVKNILIMGLLFLFVVLGQYLASKMMARLAQETIYTIREDLSKKLVHLPISFYDQNSQGEIMSTFTNDIDVLTQSLEQSISQVILSIIQVIGTFLMMLYLNLSLSLIVIVLMALTLLGVNIVSRYSAKYFKKRQALTAKLNGYVEEMISSQKLVQAYNYEHLSEEEFIDQSEELREAQTKSASLAVMIMPLVFNLSFVMYALIAIFGSIQIIQGKMTIGNITAFLQYSRNISRPIAQVSSQLNSIFSAIAGAERIFDLLDQKEENMEGEVRLIRKDGKDYWKDGEKTIPLQGQVEMVHVHFSYEKDQEILHNISLLAKPGQKIALVGSTGAGKTTISNLITRFYDIQEGQILLDGIDVRRINKYDLRSSMAMVLQDVKLFSQSIEENIRFGNLLAKEEDIIEAAKRANAYPFISKLQNGFSTEIGDSKASLSQGERQLLSIARALIADPQILILDEATSSVDTRTEELISEAMKELMVGRTTFVIAHRLSTIRDADEILVLEKGKIIERGNHQELMEEKGRYYNLNQNLFDSTIE